MTASGKVLPSCSSMQSGSSLGNLMERFSSFENDRSDDCVTGSNFPTTKHTMKSTNAHSFSNDHLEHKQLQLHLFYLYRKCTSKQNAYKIWKLQLQNTHTHTQRNVLMMSKVHHHHHEQSSWSYHHSRNIQIAQKAQL